MTRTHSGSHRHSDSPAPIPSQFVARSPVDLVAMVPIVLGFHPHESVVLMTFGPAGASFHARVDLPSGADGRREVVAMLVDAARTNDVTSAAVVLLSRDLVGARETGLELATALLAAKVEVIDVVRADGDHLWSLRPHTTDGPGRPYDLRAHPFTAERVLEGRAAFRNRGELAATLEPDQGPTGRSDRAEIARSAAGFARACSTTPARRRSSPTSRARAGCAPRSSAAPSLLTATSQPSGRRSRCRSPPGSACWPATRPCATPSARC